MVAYYLVMIVLIGSLFWLLYKTFIYLSPTKPRTKTIEEKQEELDSLLEFADDLDQEVGITNRLVEVDSKIDNLEDQLDNAENKRTSE